MDEKKINLNNPPVKFAICSVGGKMMNVPVDKRGYRLFKFKLLCDIFTRPIRRAFYTLFVTPVIVFIIRPYVSSKKAIKSLKKFILSNPPAIPLRPGAHHIDENGFFKYDCIDRGDYDHNGKADPNYKGAVQTREMYDPMTTPEDMAEQIKSLSEYKSENNDGIGEWFTDVDPTMDIMKKMHIKADKNELLGCFNEMLNMMKKYTHILPYMPSTIKQVTDLILKTINTVETESSDIDEKPARKKAKKASRKKTGKKTVKKTVKKKTAKKKNPPKKKP